WSPSTSVATPPRPNTTSGPNTGSCTTPTSTSTPPESIGSTTTPVRRAPDAPGRFAYAPPPSPSPPTPPLTPPPPALSPHPRAALGLVAQPGPLGVAHGGPAEPGGGLDGLLLGAGQRGRHDRDLVAVEQLAYGILGQPSAVRVGTEIRRHARLGVRGAQPAEL